MLKEFKEFISRGSVVDLSIGIIIGGAFAKIVESFVNDIISPLIGMITGVADLSSLQWTLTAERVVEGEVVPASIVNLGAFLEAIINFLIIGFAIFIVVKAINKFKRKEAAKAEEVATPSETENLLKAILFELQENKRSNKNE